MIGQSPSSRHGLSHLFYRIKQGIRALFAFAYPVDREIAVRILAPAQLALFDQLSRSEQLHSLRVLQDVQAQQVDTPESLAVAALLHDVGKIRCRLATWQKTMAVLVRKLAPEWEQQFSEDDTLTFWRAPFVVRRHHPRWSYDLLHECGADEATLWLVRHHADSAQLHVEHPYHDLLVRLKMADDAN